MNFNVTHPHIENYINRYEKGEIVLNEERVQLLKWLESNVLCREDVWFDEKQIEHCITFIEKYFFPLADFQKFLICFVFLMTKEDGVEALYFDSHFWTMARGSGKNGLVSGISSYCISPLHDVDGYNVSIVANSEEQAMTSFNEVYNMIDRYEETDPVIEKVFYKNKVEITGKPNKSILKYRTSAPNTKDSLRDGMVIFDEIHVFETNERLEVFESGLGKVPFSRIFYIGTNGFTRDGVYDKKVEIAREILSGDDPYTRMFPWICKLDDLEEMDDFDMWEKANPMYSAPRTSYAAEHFRRTKRRYFGIRSGQTDKIKFTIKNMNTLLEDTNRTAVPKEELIAATAEVPDDTSEFSCIGGCDFAQARDFTACGVLFMDENEEYIWKHHSFVNQNFLNQFNVKAPISEWEAQGLLTIIDEPLISVDAIVDWFVKMREENPALATIVVDLFKLNALKKPLEEAGFEVLYIRNPTAISGQVSDKIDRVFASRSIRWGLDYMMRWYTNNVYVQYDKAGNKKYEKKEELRRKTDGFMALVYAFFYANTNLSPPERFILDDIEF